MTHNPSPSIVQLLELCEAAARAGGKELVAWRGRFQAREKAPADLVTDADLASQSAVRKTIAASFPDHQFFGEEQPPDARTFEGSEPLWLCDPLDGTTNYVHGFPCYSVSVAVAGAPNPSGKTCDGAGRELLAGVIFDPIADECFAAARGQGASLNGEPIHVSDVATVPDALVAVSLPPRVTPDAPDLVDFVRVVQECQAIRRCGSAALNLAYVASGRLDAFWATHINAWDVAAGVLLIREAGGIVSGRNGNSFDLRNPHFVSAANDHLHRDLFRVLAERTM